MRLVIRLNTTNYIMSYGNKIKGSRVASSKRRKDKLMLEYKSRAGPSHTQSGFNINKRLDPYGAQDSFNRGNTIGNGDLQCPGRYSTLMGSFTKKKGANTSFKRNKTMNQTLPGPADYVSHSPSRIKGGTIGTTIRSKLILV